MLPICTVTNKYQYDMILDDSQITDDTAVWYSIDFVIFSSCHSFYELWRPFFYSKCEKAHPCIILHQIPNILNSGQKSDVRFRFSAADLLW